MSRSHLLLIAAIAILGSLFALRGMSGSAPAATTPSPTTSKAEAAAVAPAPLAREATPAPAAPVVERKVSRAPVEVPEKVSPREAQLAERVRASGPAIGTWTEAARALAGTAQVECHRAGCIATSSFGDELAFEVADEALTESAAFKSYQGWRHRSVHKDASGRVVSTWFFMNPTEG